MRLIGTKWFGMKKTILAAAGLGVILLSALGIYGVGKITAVQGTAQQPQNQQSVLTDTRKEIELPVLMYHHVLENSKLLGDYVITPQQLESDFQFLQQQGYTPIVVQQLIDYVKTGAALPEKPVIITFDDGYESNYAYAYPLLQKYNFKAVVSIYGTCTDSFSEKEDKHLSYSHITWKEIQEMMDSGLVEFQNHTYNLHKNGKSERKGIKKLPGETVEQYQNMLREDLGKLQNEFLENTGTAPTAFVYPFGQLEKEADDVLKELGFQASFCCQEKLNTVTRDEKCLWKLNRFNRPHSITTEEYFKKVLKNSKVTSLS